MIRWLRADPYAAAGWTGRARQLAEGGCSRLSRISLTTSPGEMLVPGSEHAESLSYNRSNPSSWPRFLLKVENAGCGWTLNGT